MLGWVVLSDHCGRFAAWSPRRVTALSTRLATVHGMLSAAIMIAAYAVIAVGAAYTAVKVIRGGPHGG